MAEVARQLTPEEEKQTIRDIAVAAEAQTKVGDTFYLITQSICLSDDLFSSLRADVSWLEGNTSWVHEVLAKFFVSFLHMRWWQNWLEYVNQNQSGNVNDGSSSEHHGSVSSSTLKRPSCIDNSDLIDETVSEDSALGIELHDTLVEGTDYILLPQEVWNQLYSWYGGGPVLPRKVINTGLSQTELSVEVYPLRLQLHLMPKGDRSAIRISKKETIGELHRRACEIFDLTPKQIRGHLIYRFLEDPLISLSSIKDDDHLTAYKIPKVLKNTKFLQLIHRREEQGTGNAQSTLGWKPYGTPLVSPISCDDTITRSDIQLIVHTMLSPMLRTKNCGAVTSSNASVTASDQSHADSDVTNARKGDGGNFKLTSLEKLPLQLVDENNACIDLTVGDDKVVKLSSSSMSILVFVDWSQKLLGSYDTSNIENLPEVCKYGHVSKKARNEPLSLYTCLEAFLREEPLVPEDMWYCPQCKERRQASKKLDLWRLPEVLVIHLKRFSYSRSMKHKLDTFVNFPIHDFDLTNYVANKNSTRRQIYELYALINHYGGMGSGHYTAHIKLLDENRWYNFDDSHISPINEEEVKSAAAYVLFYRRVNNDRASASNGVYSTISSHNIPSSS
ncbi:Ubiquitin carboxyl-terminal hydrolase 5 [Sesamum angolense]|uniref:Ubiquitin carboxyl-terminal hydrolase 5 n=1 Tax=Sesamum angolense TaxID=2727404 RepID=A0AAE1XBA0_9LAMI|nr:Ubiquitin carboxyl-terminal hydrolase 5 [Sesamum angolense]